ncbi:MAG: YafY family transcriptional regulator [Cellvibrionaceae bacterium]|nr:YafY family transcriptional regulator [Cellvibrionaceae bacterium]
MHKAERLFKIVNLLRNRRTVLTAKQLALELGVSERTLYRDMQSLTASGVPIEGEAGVGYRIQRHFECPPLMFDRDEVEAILLGAKMVRNWSDRQLAASASSALNKILAVLPAHLREIEETTAIRVPDLQAGAQFTEHSATLREAIQRRLIVEIDYEDAQHCPSRRRVWPLGLFFWGSAWTLVAWCELRGDYRVFRLDRIKQFRQTSTNFLVSKTCSLDNFMALQRQCASHDGDAKSE